MWEIYCAMGTGNMVRLVMADRNCFFGRVCIVLWRKQAFDSVQALFDLLAET